VVSHIVFLLFSVFLAAHKAKPFGGIQAAVNHRSSGNGQSPTHRKSLVTNGKNRKGIPMKLLILGRKKEDHLRGKVEITDGELFIKENILLI